MSNTEVIAYHHALLAACVPQYLGTIDQSGTRLCGLCRVRARELMGVSARMADEGMDRSDVRLLLHHACACLDGRVAGVVNNVASGRTGL